MRAAAPPFRSALELAPCGRGRYAAALGRDWTVGAKAHGGLLLALLVRAGLARLGAEGSLAGPSIDAAGREAELDPLAIAADFLRAPDAGPVELHTEVLKRGRTVSVVAIRLLQDERAMLAATVTAGRLPADAPQWADLPNMPAEPPADAIDPSTGTVFGLAGSCDLRFDRATAAYARGETAPPVLRGWVRPRGEEPDPLFALLAGDILPPTVFNVSGRVGWAPTVQLTGLLRARPAPGWLRLESRSRTVAGPWFDEDTTVVDAAGRLVCQARQLALAPLVVDGHPLR
jgi:acyl-coenzyme A thioesterase PaaI-like protein